MHERNTATSSSNLRAHHAVVSSSQRLMRKSSLNMKKAFLLPYRWWCWLQHMYARARDFYHLHGYFGEAGCEACPFSAFSLQVLRRCSECVTSFVSPFHKKKEVTTMIDHCFIDKPKRTVRCAWCDRVSPDDLCRCLRHVASVDCRQALELPTCTPCGQSRGIARGQVALLSFCSNLFMLRDQPVRLWEHARRWLSCGVLLVRSSRSADSMQPVFSACRRKHGLMWCMIFLQT